MTFVFILELTSTDVPIDARVYLCHDLRIDPLIDPSIWLHIDLQIDLLKALRIDPRIDSSARIDVQSMMTY